MSEPRVMIGSVDGRKVYQPGETLEVEYRIDSLSHVPIRWIEISVLWRTEGKGEEDLAVHYFERISDVKQLSVDLRRARRFSTTLPSSPLSYEGVIVKVRWCARVRIALASGKEMVAEWSFRLGHVPRVVVSAEKGAGSRE